MAKRIMEKANSRSRDFIKMVRAVRPDHQNSSYNIDAEKELTEIMNLENKETVKKAEEEW